MDMAPPQTILLIDDDPSIRRLCSRMLSRMGFTLLEADSGTSARAQFETHASALVFVLLDLHLPDCPGEELAKEFTTRKPELPVVFFSGALQSEGSKKEDGPVQYYLKKPFTKQSIEHMLAEIGVETSSPSSEQN
jgi:DNA-binding NtrC family response regulator